MLKIFAFRHFNSPFTRPLRYLFSEKNEFQQLPTVIDQNKTFFKNIYGLELDKHILPYNSIQKNWKLESMLSFRKKMPNFVVILVRKALEDANIGEDSSIDLSHQFYNVCTYCKVKYHKDYTQLEGLYKVKFQKIRSIEDKTKTAKQVEILENNQTVVKYKNDDEVEELELNTSEDKNISQILLSQKKPIEKLNLTFYALEIKRELDHPFLFDYKLEIKLKYLIQTYKAFFPSYERGKFFLFNLNEAVQIIYRIAQQMSHENMKQSEIQKVLQARIVEDKINLLQDLMYKTLDWKFILKHFEKDAESAIRNKKIYEYYTEIMKLAKQSIDGKKGKQLFIERTTKQFLEKLPPKEIKEAFQLQKQKYMQLQQSSIESSVAKKYLEDLSKIPYGIKSDQIFDLDFAEKTLDEEHYGMKDVKDAILQIIAVGKLKGSLKGKIFCLIGGPGLGKTTIAKSIAKSLGRKFYNISLGGVTDSSVLKGHRRTYMAAYAGKIIEALKTCETNNPVILLDEIDKMGSSYQGDPRSELLQILDPNQNSSFVDNYIDLPVNLSNVLFVCSANYEKNISKPLLDRVQKIRLNSYTDDQKMQIFKRHLLRRAIDKSGVKVENFVLQNSVIDALIYQYSLGEPGVRRLQKNIEQILQKVAYKVVTDEPLPIQIEKENLREYLGNSYYNKKDHHSITKGVAISLGGGDYGSRLTYIQAFKKSFANKKQHRRGMMFTGSLGDVFKEAMNISYTYARNFLANDLQNYYLYQNEIHIHAPDGASKKDGSTDSLTIAAALVSLALQKQVKKGIAMTGELTLHGRVLRTSGIKQKVLLARRQKLHEIIIPAENFADISALADNIKEGINFHFVKQFNEVHKILFYNQSEKVSLTV